MSEAAAIDYAAWVARSDRFRIVCVQNYGASGTLFLQSLLDFHPETVSLPGLALATFFEDWRAAATQPEGTRIATVLGQAASLFDASHPLWRDWGMDALGDDRTASCAVDQTAFLGHFGALYGAGAGASRRRFLCAVYLAHSFARGRVPAEGAVLVFPIHGAPPSTAEDVEADFPDALYLHMVRHPVSTAVSVARHIAGRGLDEFVPPIERALDQVLVDRKWIDGRPCHGDRPYFARLGPRARALRLEALHEDPQGSTAKLAAFLGIAWDATLLRSTVSGLAWWNRAESPRLSGFDPQIPSRGVAERTHGAERLAIRLAALPKLIAWNYPDAMPWRGVPDFAVRAVFALASLVPFAAERAAPPEAATLSGAISLGRFWPETTRGRLERRLAGLAAFAGLDGVRHKTAPPADGGLLCLFYRRAGDGLQEGTFVQLAAQAPRLASDRLGFAVLEDAAARPAPGALIAQAFALAAGRIVARWRRYIAIRRALWRGYAQARTKTAEPVPEI